MTDLFDKENFPYFRENPEAVFFDNASTTHIHDSVLSEILSYYSGYRASPGRGGYDDTDRATQAVNTARCRVANLLGPYVNPDDILFTTGATQGLNWIAKWNAHLPGNVIITEAEHNSNIIPWLSQARTNTSGITVLPVHDHQVDYSYVNNIIKQQSRAGILSITTKSNLTGGAIDWKMLVSVAASNSVMSTALDMSQSIMLEDFSASELQISDFVDWAVFSGHKIFGPTGIGVLYTKNSFKRLPIYGGGGMVDDVTFNGFTTKSGIDVHQAGTPDTAGIIGMGMCCELLNWYGVDNYRKRVDHLYDVLIDLGLLEIPELTFLGQENTATNIFSFTSTTVDVSDIATLLNQQGISVRHGKMCAYPYAERLMSFRPDTGILRISLAAYNTEADCRKLVSALKQTIHKLTQ